MKKIFIISLSLAVAVSSCKKESQTDSSLKSINAKNTDTIPGNLLSNFQNQSHIKFVAQPPGAGSSQLFPQADGTYKAQWYGEMTFGDIPHRIVNVVDGEPVPAVEIINVNSTEYISIQTCGPYFVVIRPTFVGNVETTREQFKAFTTAYNNYINGTTDSNGALIQSSLPNLDNYVNGANTGNGEIIVKGKVVSSNSSPSKMIVVEQNYPTPGTLVE